MIVDCLSGSMIEEVKFHRSVGLFSTNRKSLSQKNAFE
jgi:hypothetical protein